MKEFEKETSEERKNLRKLRIHILQINGCNEEEWRKSEKWPANEK